MKTRERFHSCSVFCTLELKHIWNWNFTSGCWNLTQRFWTTVKIPGFNPRTTNLTLTHWKKTSALRSHHCFFVSQSLDCLRWGSTVFHSVCSLIHSFSVSTLSQIRVVTDPEPIWEHRLRRGNILLMSLRPSERTVNTHIHTLLNTEDRIRSGASLIPLFNVSLWHFGQVDEVLFVLPLSLSSTSAMSCCLQHILLKVMVRTCR